MCVVCGCSGSDAGPAKDPSEAPRVDPRSGDLHYGAGSARVSVPGLSQQRTVKLEADILGENQRIAAQNRAQFQAHGVTALNLVSSPGSGKTTLLCATLAALRERHPELGLAVIEGDQQTSLDAERIRATGVPAVQVNTGKGCHLDAAMVARAFAQLHQHAHQPGDGAHDPHHHNHHHHAHDAASLLFIENVGNLVCPAAWDLGEQAKVAILSVTEGEDKPLKYPDMFAAARLMILNKVDLLPHLQFDVARCLDYARRINPALEIIQLSATSGVGLDAWLHWIEHAMHPMPTTSPDPASELAALRRRVAALEAELGAARALAG